MAELARPDCDVSSFGSPAGRLTLDPYVQGIANTGALFPDSRITNRRGRPHECHQNAAVFWLKGQCDAIVVGYYLGPDDIWRQTGVSIPGA